MVVGSRKDRRPPRCYMHRCPFRLRSLQASRSRRNIQLWLHSRFVRILHDRPFNLARRWYRPRYRQLCPDKLPLRVFFRVSKMSEEVRSDEERKTAGAKRQHHIAHPHNEELSPRRFAPRLIPPFSRFASLITESQRTPAHRTFQAL